MAQNSIITITIATAAEVEAAARSYHEDIMTRPWAPTPALPPELTGLVEDMAKASHEAWAESKRAAGYVYGNDTSDEYKTHELLVPYEDLAEEHKEESRRNARTSIQLILSVGCTVSKTGTPATEEQLAKKIEQIVEALHDEWAYAKFLKCYYYAETRNDDTSKGKLTHRDLLPMNMLMQIHPEDAAYDRDTAVAAIHAVQDAGFIISV